MATKVRDDLYWIAETYDLNKRPYPKKMHIATYLIKDGDTDILVDTGSFLDRDEIFEQVDDLVGPGGLDILIISHEDLPHSGNLNAFIEKYDSLEVIGSTSFTELYGLPSEIQTGAIGEVNDVGGREVRLIDAPIGDIQHSMWVVDHTSDVLFPTDGMGYYHLPDDATKTFGEIDHDHLVDNIREYHEENLPWIEYTDPQVLIDTIHDFLEEYDVRYIAPIHGNPIGPESMDAYLDHLERAIIEIADGFEVPRRPRSPGRLIE